MVDCFKKYIRKLHVDNLPHLFSYVVSSSTHMEAVRLGDNDRMEACSSVIEPRQGEAWLNKIDQGQRHFCPLLFDTDPHNPATL